MRRECVESVFERVISGSTYERNALALATVVVILLLRINAVARLDKVSCLCAAFLPKLLIFFLCLITKLFLI